MKAKETIVIFLKKNILIVLLALFVLVDVFSYALIFAQNNKKNLNQLFQEKVFIQKDSSLTTGDSCCKLGKENLKSDFAGCQNDKFVVRDSLQNFDMKNIPKISDIRGPRIDDQAASVEKVLVSNSAKKTFANSTLPTKLWVFLIFAYIALLIFNLAYNFNSAVKIQWFWELLYTLLAIAVWLAFDSQKINIWYPVFILKVGIIIYAVYLYLFNKKIETKNI